MDYQFGLAGQSELREIVDLYLKAVKAMEDNQIFQWDELYPNEEVLTDDIINQEMYVLSRNGKLLACVVINEEQDGQYLDAPWQYLEGKIAVIHRLCVNPDVQGSGIGRIMMNYTEKKIKELGYHLIRLDTFSDNFIARSLYEKLGYQYAGTVQFRKGLFYLLEKKL